jgi:membrane associated rhomboid family serine protease
MESTGIAGFILIIVNVLVSYKGLTEPGFLERYAFDVDEILIHKDYKRLVTSGFLHISWTHLFLNMLTLYAFSSGVENILGVVSFLVIYFASLVGGDLLALFIHRNHGDYTSVGASGAISGIIFASIAIFPGMELSLFGLHAFIPAWLYGLLYVLYSIYGIQSQRDNIGHGAHLGGGIVGMLVAIAIYPISLRINYIPILLIVIPAAIFMYLIISKPRYLIVGNFSQNPKGFRTVEDKYNQSKLEREKELDRLLDRINRKGMEGLTPEEKDRLKDLGNGN